MTVTDNLDVTGKITATVAPSLANDVVRKSDLDAAIAAITPGTIFAVQATNSATLDLSAGDLTAVVRRKTSGLTSSEGQLVETADGLAVLLGSGGAAAFGHTHPEATVSAAGLMAAADKTKLNSMTALQVGVDVAAEGHVHALATVSANGFMSTAQVTTLNALAASSVTNDNIHEAMAMAWSDSNSVDVVHTDSNPDEFKAHVRLKASAFIATEGQLLETADGLVAKIGAGASDLAPGNHTHAVADGGNDGLLASADYTALQNLVTAAITDVVDSATISSSGTATRTLSVKLAATYAWTGAHTFTNLQALSGGNIVIESLNTRLNRADGSESVNWASNALKDTAANTSLDWHNRCLTNVAGNNTIDWQTGELKRNDGTTAVDWENRTLSASFVGSEDGNRVSVVSGKLNSRKVGRGAWGTGQGYTSGDVFTASGKRYLALEDHTSTSIAADEASGDITEILTKAELPHYTALPAAHGRLMGDAIRRVNSAAEWALATTLGAQGFVIGNDAIMSPGHYYAAAHGFTVGETYYRNETNARPDTDSSGDTRQILFYVPDSNHLHILITPTD